MHPLHRQLAAGMRVASGVNYLLQDYPGAAAAYSLRDLTGTNPDVVRVKRTGDNAEADFNAGEVADGTLTSWVVAGGGTLRGWVTTLYDQSGNGPDLPQIYNNNMPYICYASGEMYLENGKPAMYFIGGQWLKYTGWMSLSQPLTILAVFNQPGGDYVYDNSDRLSLGELSGIGFGFYAGSAWVRKTNSIANQQALSALMANGASSTHRINGATWLNGNGGTAGIGQNFTVGSAYNANLMLRGSVQEVVIYDADKTSDIVGIEANINDFYGIY
jgi:hypothetical protein